jgi:hypothetical protein
VYKVPFWIYSGLCILIGLKQARYIKDNKTYALKIIQPEEDDDVSEFVELAILKRANNKNICKLLGTWKKEEETFVRELFSKYKSLIIIGYSGKALFNTYALRLHSSIVVVGL